MSVRESWYATGQSHCYFSRAYPLIFPRSTQPVKGVWGGDDVTMRAGSAMVKRKLFWACTLLPLYAVTWIGGWTAHARQLQESAERSYRFAQRENEEMEAQSRKDGLPFHPIQLRAQGPFSKVYWCVPVLPGVLLADSAIYNGPLSACDGVKLVIYYGVGSVELPTPCYWVT